MKLEYNRDIELEVVSFGIFKPGQVINLDDETEAKRYLNSGYFDLVKEKKEVNKEEKTKITEKITKVKVKKSKKEGDDKK